ncbi:hypothetical protein HYU20_00120 [Candidatus Woesearchaeota archaeon]|nr:hypothetical protein [Candidatus Woesearchaeota archaeon]
MMPVADRQTAKRIDIEGRIYLGAPLSNSFLIKTHYKVKGSEVSHKGIIMLPESVFYELANKVDAGFGYLDQSPDVRSVRRFFFSSFLQPHDSHGRMTIPQVMLAYAGLGRDVYITPRHNYLMLTRELLDGNEVEGTTLDGIIRVAEVRSLRMEQKSNATVAFG